MGVNEVVFSSLSDLRFQLLSRPASGNIALIKIDAPSIKEIGVWPWPRRYHAKLIDKLRAAGVTDIAFDVDFSSPSSPAEDKALAAALKRVGGSTILPAFKQIVRKGPKGTQVYNSLPYSSFQKHSWAATVNVWPDSTGTVREYGFGARIKGQFYPSMGALLAGVYETQRRSFSVDFGIKPSTIPTFSYIDIVNGKIGPSQLKGKKVIVGGTAVELGDRFLVPTHGLITGPVLQILASESISQNRAMQTTGLPITLAGLILIIVIGFVTQWSFGPRPRAVALVTVAFAIEAAALLVQAVAPIMIDTSMWIMAIGVLLVLATIEEVDLNKLLATIAERRFQTIAHSLNDGVICTDRDGRITFWNAGAESLFGFGSREVTGKSIEELISLEVQRGKAEPRRLDVSRLSELVHTKTHTQEFIGLRKDDTSFPLEACLSQWNDGEGLNYGITVRDITARKQEEERIRLLAEHDTLTGLYNRNHFNIVFDTSIEQARLNGGRLAVLIIDLDDFKDVNDTLGHPAGDAMLRKIGEVLGNAAPGHILSRMGGDEFSILIQNLDSDNEANSVAETILHALNSTPFWIDGHKLSASASIGISIYPEDGTDTETLLANADLALYRAKEARVSDFSRYSEQIRHELVARVSLENELAKAIENHEFEVYYQPQADLLSGRIVGAEALIRWNHPLRGLIAPEYFMKAVNNGKLSEPVGNWVMETAIKQGRTWELAGFDVRVGINISPWQFKSDDLPSRLAKLLDRWRLSPSLVELELTEDILIEDDQHANRVIEQIRGMGVNIALDDFGTGYASLIYLKRFPLDRLKIDRSFVQDMTTDADDAAIVRAIVDLCRAMRLSVIAEGIEDQETIGLLQDIQCAEGQGYYYGRPMPASQLERLLVSQSRHTRPSEQEMMDLTV